MPANTEPVLDVIFGRRSIRAYTPGAVDDSLVEKLLQAAMAAPSAGAKDPWRFVVIRSRLMLERLAETLPHGRMLTSAALAIVVCGDQTATHDQQLSYLLQDCSACVANLLLCAHVLELGACWLGIHPRESRVQRVREFLALPSSVVPVSCVAIGWPAEAKEPRTRFNPAFVHLERW